MLTVLRRHSDFDPAIQLVLDALPSEHSKRAYRKALSDFLEWRDAEGRPPLTKALVNRYRALMLRHGRAPATINQALAAVRKLASEAADNGLLDPVVAQGIAHAEGVSTHGVRTGNWLSLEEAQQLINAPDTTTRLGLRDRAVLAVMIGCGLRRSEVASLEFAHLARRDDRWVILDLVGKGRRVRTVPVPGWAKLAIDAWAAAAGLAAGRVFRAMNKADRVERDSLTPQAVLVIVARYGQVTGLAIAPHDLRRTFAKLAHKGGAGLDQLQLSLGHASIQTTERYLGVEQDLVDAPGDRLALHL